MASSVRGLAHDAVELGELQAELLVCEIKSAGQQIRVSVVLVLIGISLLLGSTPIGLIAFAELLNAQFQWPPAAGYAIAATVGVLLSAVALLIAYKRIEKGGLSFAQTREELARSIAWIKSQLSKRNSRDTRNPISIW
jgi:hypothetical protein